jgi:hypothetical protein
VKDEFKLFQETFKKYQDLFGLNGYKVYFTYEPVDDGFASINVDQSQMVATVTLHNSLPDKDKPFIDVERSAKHEALHLLLFRLEDRAFARFTQREELLETVEEAIFRLEKLIPDIK